MQDYRRGTQQAYERAAAQWVERKRPTQIERAKALRARTDGVILDLGCGPGWHMPFLAPAIGADLSSAMLRQGDQVGAVVNADMMSMPFARQSLAGAWASRSLVHIPRAEVPMALAELHRVLDVDAHAELWLFEGDKQDGETENDPLPGRTFSFWPIDELAAVLTGAGFAIDELERWQSSEGWPQITARIRRTWTLPDYVGPNMKLLVCGLNPSPSSADSGIGFYKAGNRFWPAALRAQIVSRDRDPFHAFHHHRVGMTDLAKRPTRRADELDRNEYLAGVERLRSIVDRLQPEVILIVGLAGWRAAIDRRAQRGWQPERFAGRPVYLMPSTSGLNAHDTIDSLADHLAAAASSGAKGL